VKWKKDDEGKLVLDDSGDPIAIDESGNAIDLSRVVAAGKHERVVSERDEYKTKAGDLEKQIDDLKQSVGNADELKTKVEELTSKAEQEKSEFETRLAAKDKEYALDTALLDAGVPGKRLKAAKALIDLESVKVDDGKLAGLDLAAFKKDNSYLFETVQPKKTAAPSSSPSVEDLEKMDMDEYAKARSGKSD
jgi:vacuolar-type H+-ATPase subunit I/STV1